MFLGIEIGGTKLQLGVGRGDGTIIAHWRGLVEHDRAAPGIRQTIVEAIPLLLKDANINRSHIRRVGIGFGGPIDDRTGTIIKSHQIEGWELFPILEWVKDEIGFPACLGNDADVAGLAEAKFGAGRGHDPVFYVTIGSGIGGGLILGGRIFRGAGLGAAEIGHLRMRTPEGYSTLEHLASGWGIERRGNLSTRECAERYRAGDPDARTLLDSAWEYLAEGLCLVIALCAPSRIVIGGGVSLMGDDVFFAPLRRMVAERVFQPFAGSYSIVAAELAEMVVVHGAIALAASDQVIVEGE